VVGRQEVATASRAPAAPRAWPCIDLVELTISFPMCSENTARMASTSVASFARVPVPWAFMYPTVWMGAWESSNAARIARAGSGGGGLE